MPLNRSTEILRVSHNQVKLTKMENQLYGILYNDIELTRKEPGLSLAEIAEIINDCFDDEEVVELIRLLYLAK